MDMKCHEILEQKMCKEIEMIEAKYAQNPSQEMSMQDLEKLNKLYHTLKSQATYAAMKEAEEYETNMSGYSGRRGRNPMNGQYMSRDMGGDGYDYGYSDAPGHMNGNSGHYPMYPNVPRRW